MHDIKASPKKFWSYVKSKIKTISKIPSLRKADGTLVDIASEKAEVLNEIFCSTFTNEEVQNIQTVDSDPYLGEYLDNFVISRGMVQGKLKELNPGKTPGPDGWHPVLLIGIAPVISLPLSILFQKSPNEGIFPSQWLKACITTIHKKCSKINPENYRAISIASIGCKIMESIVRDKLLSHMELNDLFSNNQHGFV